MTTPAFTITLTWPPATLSGHNTGHWAPKAGVIKAFRLEAWAKTLKVRAFLPKDGDIRVHVRFVPPNRRGDRTNYPNRMKPIYDGIADALKVNDRRFLPSYDFAEPEKPGRLEIRISAA